MDRPSHAERDRTGFRTHLDWSRGWPAKGMQLSTRLMLIIATCLIPLAVLQAVTSLTYWSDRKGEIGTLATHQAGLLAGGMASISEGARILLTTTAEFRQVRQRDRECEARLTNIRRNAPSFAFIARIEPDGRIGCASGPVATEGDPAWITAALAATTFTAGRFARSAEFPGGFLPYYLPLRNEGDSGAHAALVASLDLSWLGQHLLQLKQTGSALLPTGVLTIADADGTILARNPQHAEFLGRSFPPAAMPAVRAHDPGALRLTSIDGVDRIVGYIPPGPANYHVSSLVGFNEADILVPHRWTLIRGALLMAVTALGACLLTWAVARRFITYPTNGLLAAARRWREGDLTARAPCTDQRSEFGLLAAACNEMASVLARREEQLREYADGLEARVAARTQELLVTNNRLQVEIEERHNTEAALLQSQKLQVAGRLAGGIAHDFNNLLATIQGSLDLLSRSVEEPKHQKWIDRASGAVSRGAQLTGRLLAFSRRRRLAVQATDANRLIADLVALFGAATLGYRVHIETDLAEDLWPAMVEPSQIEAALLNLALNARDAMPDGGLITLATRNRTLAAASDGLEPGDYVEIAVIDTGIGMTEDVAQRALEPFFTTKGQAGSGLGLSQVHAMIREYGGAIKIRSQPGEGTEITLRLPRATQISEPSIRPAPNSTRTRLKQTALVVDDDPDVLEITADMLRQLGYCVIVARSGQEALDRWESAENAPGLVVLDFAMPGMNGLTLARTMRERGFTGSIVLATGYADLAEIGQLDSDTLQAVLSKPYSFQELAHILETVEERMAARVPLSLIDTAR